MTEEGGTKDGGEALDDRRRQFAVEDHGGKMRARSEMNGGAAGNGMSLEGELVMEKTVEELRRRMEDIRHDVVEQVNSQLHEMVSEVMQKLKSVSKEGIKDRFNEPDYRDKRKSSNGGALPDKVFVERNSLLNDLFEVKHIHAIYNIFLVILIILFINTVVHDVMVTGRMNVGINIIVMAFGKITTVAEIWLQMMVTTFGVYVLFNLWAHHRLELSPKSSALKMWDYGWLGVFTIYQIGLIVCPAKAVLDADLPPASSFIILMEEIRLLMKTHAFVRTNAPIFLGYKPHTESSTPRGPGFSNFLYFMFAPTLVYRDKYPRTKEIRWKFVVRNLAEVLMVIFCVALICERFLAPAYQDFGTKPLELKTLILSIVSSSMPGILIFLCGFYCLLHCWMNAWAELLRFADRLFYKDWWNSTSFAGYYRTWNVVVHDWLYMYVYKDIYEVLAPGNQFLSVSTVFLASAIFHEFVLAIGFRFFCPVLLVLIAVFSLAKVALRRHIGNLFLWWTLCVGNGVVVSLYTLEYYARQNCSPTGYGLVDYVVPRSWTCHRIVFPWSTGS